MERNKYLIYNHFEEAQSGKTKDLSQSEVIEIEWDQIKSLEEETETNSSQAVTTGPSSTEDLGVS